MAFTYPLDMPSTPGLRMSRFGVQWANIAHVGLSGAEQHVRRGGDKFIFEWELPTMRRALAASWQAFGMKLQGTHGTFYGYDPDAKSPRGAALSSYAPLVNGASQTGTALVTDAWANSIANVLLPGDYISVGSRLKMVVDAASSDGTGNATLNISPPIVTGQSPADNAAITVFNPKGIFRLTSDAFIWDADYISRYGMTFQAVEALDT